MLSEMGRTKMTLDEIRADLEAQRAEWADKAHVARHNFDIAEAKLAAHDRAVAAMPMPVMGDGQAAWMRKRAPRRDIAALVREALTAEPQTVAQIAEKVGVPPSRALPALKKVGTFVADSQRWSAS
jgi:hypothetical protein